MIAKKWVLREKISDDIGEQLLFYRGIKTKEEAEKFFNPDYERDLGDPFKLLNMKRAVKRVVKAVEKNEKIIVYGDYDADGICASVIFHDFFQKIGFENFQIYIPDRFEEGYGLSDIAADEFVKQKAGLVIAVDCGITDHREIEILNKGGVDVIVVDHHLVSAGLPDAYAVVDPMQEKEKYPFRPFCGAGLAFKFVCALVKNGSFKIPAGWEKWLLDAAAVATIADMVPLVGENRVLVYYGLEVLKKTRRLGLLALFKKLQLDNQNIGEDDIAFSIAPCINTASRMGHGTISYSLLTTESREEAEALSADLIEKNTERKKIIEDIFRKVEAGLDQMEKLPEIIVLGDEMWPVGLLALLANRILEKYDRPVCLWGRGGITTEAKGSCRSNGSVNLVELLTEIGEKLFTEQGGHAMAAGFTLKEGASENLKGEIEKALQKIPRQKVDEQVIWLDSELELEKIGWSFNEILEKFRPFGKDNPKPNFLLSKIPVWNMKTFGNGGIHLQLDFRKPSGEIVPAIGFFSGKWLDFEIDKSSVVDLAASLEKSTFKGYPELRLRIVAIRKSDSIL